MTIKWIDRIADRIDDYEAWCRQSHDAEQPPPEIRRKLIRPRRRGLRDRRCLARHCGASGGERLCRAPIVSLFFAATGEGRGLYGGDRPVDDGTGGAGGAPGLRQAAGATHGAAFGRPFLMRQCRWSTASRARLARPRIVHRGRQQAAATSPTGSLRCHNRRAFLDRLHPVTGPISPYTDCQARRSPSPPSRAAGQPSARRAARSRKRGAVRARAVV
jgi:hypothetical protein